VADAGGRIKVEVRCGGMGGGRSSGSSSSSSGPQPTIPQRSSWLSGLFSTSTKQAVPRPSSGHHHDHHDHHDKASDGAAEEEDDARAKPKKKAVRGRGLPTVEEALLGTKSRPGHAAGTGAQDEEDDRAGRHRLLDKYKKAAM